MWTVFKPYFIRVYAFFDMTFYLFIFLLPGTRLINLYYGYMDPLHFLGLLYGVCIIIVLIIGSSHLAFIYYFSFYIFFFSEIVWRRSYGFLLQNYWFNLILNLMILFIFYFFIPSNFLFLYVYYYWFFILFNLFFFKIYFTRFIVHKNGATENALYDPYIISDIYLKLFEDSRFYCVVFCQRFNVDFNRFNHKFGDMVIIVNKKSDVFFKLFENLKTDGKRRSITGSNYTKLLISSTMSASFGFVFIRFFIWV